jgi:hypothetical protein
MKKGFLLLMGLSGMANAGIPVWTFTPLTGTSGTIPANINFVVKYTVTNNSKKVHTLVMHPIAGVSASGCDAPLAYKQSCTLTLSVNGAQVGSGVFEGPILCETTTQFLECYQPGRKDRLNFTSVGSVAIGDSYGGGKVACLNGGLNNLITANVNNGPSAWGPTNILTNATSNTNGATNTATIVNVLGNNSGTSYAAKLCSDYAVDANGVSCTPGASGCYDDWFLPAGNNTGQSGQLNCLWTNRAAIGGFDPSGYWSSTEDGVDGAWFQDFSSNTILQSTASKGISNVQVRCVRSLNP